ncbi:hypothetical protein J3B02_003135 [Coemansia erecta]|uniref:Amino acid transporter transmembrane domain-containing protein n=1 Tax=Coemansia asiatica TaxID=1052880 RepID=A0A9W7XRW1_9FUNG|nr:hypothetical protein LPJ64_000433 [Coemansia asiatica]KAJ2853452.1 hypothetical protein J3B02_003135 [Coemansia erecta]KAJ2880256.1 hypothetical protein FB639_002878 [Coemansia asiatica]
MPDIDTAIPYPSESQRVEESIGQSAMSHGQTQLHSNSHSHLGESTTKVGFNVLNTIIGSGIVCLPYALHNAGFIFGIIMLVAIAALSQFSLYALIVTGKRTNTAHFSSVTQASLGQTGYHLLNASMVIDMVGTVILYLMLVGDLITALTDIYLPVPTSRSTVIMVVSVVCVLPMLFFRNTGPLARLSIVSILCLPYIILAVAFRAPLYANGNGNDNGNGDGGSGSIRTDLSFFGPRVLPAMGVLAFTYSSCHAAFPNYLGLRNQTVRSWVHATSWASAGAGLISTAFAVVGYLSFGQASNANILNNFPATDGYINFGRFLFAITLILTIPMAFYPIRDTITEMLCIDPQRHGVSRVPESICTVAVFLTCALAAASYTDLGLAYELIGTLSSSVVNFLLPALIYLWAGTAVSFKGLARSAFVSKDILATESQESLPLLLKHDQNYIYGFGQILLWLTAWTVAGFGFWVMVLGTYNIGRGF